jgi:hypothetical protein
MNQSKQYCPKGKVVNPASGRCVDANGKIGRKVQGIEGATPLTKTAIISQIPSKPVNMTVYDNYIRNPSLWFGESKVVKQLYGPSVKLLTPELAPTLIGKTFYFTDFNFFALKDALPVSTADKMQFIYRMKVKKWDGQNLTVVLKLNKKELQDSFYVDVPLPKHKLLKRSGSSNGPYFIFIKDA